jgi:hypothetical protein
MDSAQCKAYCVHAIKAYFAVGNAKVHTCGCIFACFTSNDLHGYNSCWLKESLPCQQKKQNAILKINLFHRLQWRCVACNIHVPNQPEIETMENTEYHAHPALSASGLRVLKRSPLHYWDRYINPDRVTTEPTEAMQLGTLIHCAVLEPDQFDVRYIAVPEGIDKRTKEGKQVWADLLATGREP